MNQNIPENPFLTVQDVMRLLSVSRRTVYHWIKKGILNPSRVGSVYRFHPDDIQDLVKRKRGEPVFSKSRILAIDDDILVRESLKILFKRAGYETTVVASGKEALAVIEKAPFDLIVTDIRMPEMNGIETLKELRIRRKKMKLPDLPEIVITGYEDEGAYQEAKAMGVKAFIHKPFEWETFISTIQKYLEQ
ncbi:response regulator [Omnitrophica bacterium]|nr:response regulator [Candidatus Omnitrophota bacterium]